jgi:signal transduction histidine kinase
LSPRRTAARLALLVAFAGLVPLTILGGFALETLRARTEEAAAGSLEAVAGQVAARVQAFVEHARKEVRGLAATAALAPDRADVRRLLEDAELDDPDLADATLVDVGRPAAFANRIEGSAWRALEAGGEAASSPYLGEDQTPRMDHCVALRGHPGRALCARIDLLELTRFVQHIRTGEGGRALVLDGQGRVVASGAGTYRAAVLSGADVPHSPAAREMARGARSGPRRLLADDGAPFLLGWARVAEPPWTVVVEQPEREALRPARLARWGLAGIAAVALAVSLGVGVFGSRRMLADLAVEERWRTAGRLAAGVSHDLGHRIAVLQHTASLADRGDASQLPRIAANLRAEADTLRRFVSDFSDLSRDLAVIERRPVLLDALARSVALSAGPRAEPAGVRVEADEGAGAWVEGDRHLLERAAMNLVVNAVEASPRGGEVRVTAGRDGDECFLRVADGGGGISPERLARIFDAFASTKRSGDHLGMGLPNVKRIAEAHGGRVTAGNGLQGGAVFEIRLLAAEPPGA